jgi:hypothetical protein
MSAPVLLLALAMASTVAANEEGMPPEASDPPLQISANTEGPVGYFSPVYIRAQIRSTGAIDPECVRLVARSSIGNVFTGDPNSSCSTHPTAPPVCEMLGSGGQQGVIDVSCQMQLKNSMLKTLTSANMLLGPQRENAQLVVTLATGNNDPGKTIVTDVTISLEPPKVAVAYGGFFGAFLLGLFLLLRERVLRIPPAELPALEWKAIATYSRNGLNALIRLFQQAFTGGIVALVIILIARASEGVQPPISVSVQDFWGGTLIGLFSVPLSDWLFSVLKTVPANGQ